MKLLRNAIAAAVAISAVAVPALVRPAFGTDGTVFISLLPVVAAARFGGWRLGLTAVWAGFVGVQFGGRAGEWWNDLFWGGVFATGGFAVCLTFRSAELALRLADSREKDADRMRVALEELVRQTGVLQDADANKDEALAVLAHELRNPLSPIHSAAYLLRHAATVADRDRWCRVIEEQAKLLGRLVDDLLDVARLRHGKVQVRKAVTNLSDVVSRAVEACRQTVKDRRHQIYVGVPVDGPLYADVDADRVTQAVYNLIHNAAKYTEPGGTVWVTLERHASIAVVRVRDTGIGIAPDFLPRVWDMFTQYRTGLDREGGGIGLGLPLVRKLVELHGGSVGARSDGQGKGSEFTISLPCTALTWHSTPKPAECEPATPTRRKVLVVEDNVAAADTLAVILRMDGHHVSVVHDGVAALATASQFLPDFVLLDIGLPGMDGYEIASRLRGAGSAATVVAITGCASGEHRARGRAAGIDHYLLKPADPGVVKRILAGGRPPAVAAAGDPAD